MIGITLTIVFIASFGLVIGLYVFVGRRSLARRSTARRRLHEPAAGHPGTPASLLRDDSVSEIPLLNRWLQGSAHALNLRRDLRAAGMKVRPGTFVLAAVLLAVAGFFVGNLQGSWVTSLMLAPAGLVAPYIYLRRRKRKRLEAFDSQLPDALDMIINAMRAGYSFQAAMELVGEELPDPLGPEFSQFYEEQRLGMDVRTALLALQDRMRSMDLKMFVTAVMINRETGGNLTEVLDNIARVIRERFRIQGELQTLTAQVRLSSKILGLLPIVVVAAIALLNPAFMEPLLKEEIGHIILGIAAVSQFLGLIMMNRLSKIEI